MCGAAPSMNFLIAARSECRSISFRDIFIDASSLAIQGVGGGGILSLTSIIVSDLVPLHERGLYNGLIGM